MVRRRWLEGDDHLAKALFRRFQGDTLVAKRSRCKDLLKSIVCSLINGASDVNTLAALLGDKVNVNDAPN